ncbi:hypothetical protein [Chryseobacterium gleum]|uniref:hypothetical protein n=1 Tax=Chryseobacterium gleum TaxID=250 RepID=UPI0028A7D5A0|nr:hypothetical protein [Chryseobacterium gleum]
MKSFICCLTLLLSVILHSQTNSTVGFAALKEAKAKIENTVPLVIRSLKMDNFASKDNQHDIEKEKILLENEYVRVGVQFEKYKGAIIDCIQNNKSQKKSIKCINDNSSPLEESLSKYDDYISKLIPKKEVGSKASSESASGLDPFSLISSLADCYIKISDNVVKIRDDKKKIILDRLNTKEFQLEKFKTLLDQ